MRKLTGRNGLLHANFLQLLYSLSLFFFFLNSIGSLLGENRGQKIEYGEEFYTINNYNDVFFPIRIKFRQMDLAEELLPI